MTNGGESGVGRGVEGTTIGAAAAVLLRYGTLAAAAVGVIGTAACLVWGGSAVAGFATGAVLAAAALAVGPLLLRASRSASPPAVTAVAAGGYAGVVVALAVAFVALAPLEALSTDHLAAGLVTVTVAGLAGQIRGVTRLRVPAFGAGQDPQVEGGPASRTGDAAQSSQEPTR